MSYSITPLMASYANILIFLDKIQLDESLKIEYDKVKEDFKNEWNLFCSTFDGKTMIDSHKYEIGYNFINKNGEYCTIVGKQVVIYKTDIERSFLQYIYVITTDILNVELTNDNYLEYTKYILESDLVILLNSEHINKLRIN